MSPILKKYPFHPPSLLIPQERSWSIQGVFDWYFLLFLSVTEPTGSLLTRQIKYHWCGDSEQSPSYCPVTMCFIMSYHGSICASGPHYAALYAAQISWFLCLTNGRKDYICAVNSVTWCDTGDSLLTIHPSDHMLTSIRYDETIGPIIASAFTCEGYLKYFSTTNQ